MTEGPYHLFDFPLDGVGHLTMDRWPILRCATAQIQSEVLGKLLDSFQACGQCHCSGHDPHRKSVPVTSSVRSPTIVRRWTSRALPRSNDREPNTTPVTREPVDFGPNLAIQYSRVVAGSCAILPKPDRPSGNRARRWIDSDFTSLRLQAWTIGSASSLPVPNCRHVPSGNWTIVNEECRERFIPIGERRFRRAVTEYVAHYHHERNHQGLDNGLITGGPMANAAGRVRRRSRLGGLLNYYERAA